MDIEKILNIKSKETAISKPQFFNLSLTGDVKKLQTLLKTKKINHIVDDYAEQVKEYFYILNPSFKNTNEYDIFLAKLISKKPLHKQGNWVYFPWCSTLTHILSEESFFKVRTARNKYLITECEQNKFYNSKIGIAGLSVGNSVALAIVLQGGAKHIKLADFDRLALSNLNRIRSGIEFLGLKKVEMTARQIYQLNPYAKIEILPDGITENNINKFCENLDVIVDEIDNLAIKLRLREEAKKRKIAVVMGADNGDSAIVDVERHDKNSKISFFHNRLGNITHTKLSQLNKFETGKTIAQLIGLENHTERMLSSLQEMGKSIVSWPQLGGAAMINGSAIAYCVRRIVNNQSLEDNRAIISLEQSLQSDYFTKKQKRSREKSIQTFKKIFNL